MDNAPVIKVRDGTISISIWQNSNAETGNVFYSTQIENRYLDGEEWKSTTSFNENELLRVSNLTSLAYNKLAAYKQNQSAKT